MRDHFNKEHGAHLPEDICLCISNLPTRWQVVPCSDELAETFPDIDEDLVSEASDFLLEASPLTDSTFVCVGHSAGARGR